MTLACIYVTLTFYTLTGGSQDNAAYGGRVQPGRTVAVSPDLRHLAGQTVWIDGFGERIVNDRTGGRIQSHVDVAVGSKKEARMLGKQRGKMCWE
jgi:3D (Asp-Asp-Asp) domain-containing protein